MPSHFTPAELARYDRHFALPEFGIEAQQKLKAARVLVVGAGGLGSPLLLYLAAAGVGTIGIVDFDVVDDSNLQRQVLFGIDDLGQFKTEAAKKRLQALNPHIGSGRPMRLFCRRRVGAAEVGAEFSAAKGKASSRSADAKLRSAEKLSFLVDFSAAVEIHVPRFENRELRRLTEVEFGAAFDHDSHLENELSFVILRSRESEWALDPYYWHQGIRLARKRMRQRVLARIIEIYPALSACALVRARLETGSTETA